MDEQIQNLAKTLQNWPDNRFYPDLVELAEADQHGSAWKRLLKAISSSPCESTFPVGRVAVTKR